MKKPLLGFYITALCLLLLTSISSFATTYYVDPSSTSSVTNGTLANPWKTIAQVNAGTTVLYPGDMVLFKRGQSYSGRLTISSSGTAANPITYGNYGTGNLPEFNNAVTDIIRIYNKQYVVIDGIKIIDNSMSTTDHSIQANISYAIVVDNSPNCTIKNCDISLVGVGISVTTGSNNTTITGNYMHNMRMVRNTPTYINSNDDYGANPMVIGSSNNTISYNRFEECWALSYDYGFDGGAVELFGSTIDNNTVIYNTAINCDGFMEVGSNTNGVCNNNIVAYNKVINCGGAAATLQNSGTFNITINNLQYYNNTFIETVAQYEKSANLFWMSGTGNAGMLVVRNNIFWLSTGVNVAQTKFNSGQMIHSNNIYRMTSGSLGISLNSTELLSSSASLFTSTAGDPSTWNLNPPAGSAAINFGTAVGYTKDFAGNPIIGNPDAGILEYASSVAALTASATAGNISCNGGSTSVTVTATGGVAPYAGTGNFTVSAGTYTYTVTDANGAKSSTTVTVNQPTAITETLSAGTIGTAGGSTTITVSASGGTGSDTYSLNGAAFQSTNTFLNVLAGTYTVTVKDANACTVTKSITIAQPAALLASATAGNISCNGGSTSVTVTATGGVAPYAGTGNFTVSAGTYTYTVTDANGAKSSTTLTVNQPTAITETLSAGTIGTAGGSTTITVSASGGTGSDTYSLNGAAFQSTNTFLNVLAGTYTVTVKDANACTVTKSITIAQPAALLASASAGNISCNGGSTSVTVTATGGVAPYAGTGNFTVSAGTYTYTVTDANGAKSSTTVTVNQPTAITETLSAGTIGTAGGSTTITVSASGGTGLDTYSLNGAAFQSANTFLNVLAGTYTVTVKDANACTVTKSITIAQPAALLASASAGNISCNGGSTSVTVTATGGVAPYAGTGNFTVSAGTYTYTVTDANGAKSSTTVTVNQPTAITETLSAGTIGTAGGSTTITVSASGGTGSYTYSLNGAASQSSNTFTNVLAGTYTVTVNDANACSATKSITIAQPAALLASASAGNISCNGGSTSVTVTATGGVAPYAGTGNFTVSAGTYTYTVTDANGAKSSTTVTVNQPTAITETLSAGTIGTAGGSTTITVSASGGAGSYTYSLNGAASQSSNTFTNVLAGTYTVTVNDANACSATKSITIAQPAALLASATAGNISCNGGSTSVTVTATGGVAPYAGTGNFTVSAGTYTYTVTDANGAKSSTTVTVTQPTAITETLSAGTIGTAGGSTTITVSASGGTGSYTYSLNGAASQSSNTFTNVLAGTYTVTVNDANACTASQSITITQPLSIAVKQPAVLTVTATAGTIKCNGGSTTISVDATGGVAPYNGTGIFTVNAGTYNYTVIDANGTKSSVSVTVSQPAVLAETLSAGTISTTGGSTTITVSASGGTNPYAYNLNGSVFQSTNTFLNVLAGTYTVTVKDANTCSASGSITITEPALKLTSPERSRIYVSPNPSSNFFTLHIGRHFGTEPVEIIVYNSLGTSMYTAKGSADQSFTFGYNFIPGNYVLKVIIGNFMKSIKLIKV